MRPAGITYSPRDKFYERTDKLSIFISYFAGTVKEVSMECLFLF
jgi:hypothetical protein